MINTKGNHKSDNHYWFVFYSFVQLFADMKILDVLRLILSKHNPHFYRYSL